MNKTIATSENLKPIGAGDKLLSSILRGGNDQNGTDPCPECETHVRTELEGRDGGYSEVVSECNGCGATTVEK